MSDPKQAIPEEGFKVIGPETPSPVPEGNTGVFSGGLPGPSREDVKVIGADTRKMAEEQAATQDSEADPDEIESDRERNFEEKKS